MQRRKYIEEQEEENIALKLVTKYLPYWPLFVVAIILGLIGGYIKLKYTIPVYEASAKIIIKDEKKGNEESKLMEFQDQISSKKIVENEVEIIQSRRLMEDVVQKLALYAPITEVGEYVNSSAYVSSPIRIISPYPDSLINTAKDEKIFIEYNEKSGEVVLNGKDRHPIDKVIRTKNGPLIFQKNKYYYPQEEKNAKKEFYYTITSYSGLASGMVGSLQAEPSNKQSSIIDLTYYDEVPQRAEDVLNQLLQSYKQFELNEKELLAKKNVGFRTVQVGFSSPRFGLHPTESSAIPVQHGSH